jgi:hypothetical protein
VKGTGAAIAVHVRKVSKAVAQFDRNVN